MPSKTEDTACIVVGKENLSKARMLGINVSKTAREAVIAEIEKKSEAKVV